MALDPTDLSVRELKDRISDMDDADELRAALDAEREGDSRKTAKLALEQRINAVTEDEEPDEGDEVEDEDEGGEPEADDEPEPAGPSYPAPDSTDVVVYDTTGAGDTGTAEPPIAGHDTIHLVDEDGEPACGASSGARGQTVPRNTLAEDIDECQRCLAG